MVVPFIEVSHLASASSFFAAVLQPLGLHYIEPVSDGDSLSGPSALSFGLNGHDAILELRQSENPLKPPRLSSLVLTAPSRSAVAGFHTCGLRANPPLWSTFRSRPVFGQPDDRDLVERGGPWFSTENGIAIRHAVVYDPDGNRLEVLHRDHDPQVRVLDWKHDLGSAIGTRRASLSADYFSSGRAAMAPPYNEPSYPFGGRRTSYSSSTSARPAAGPVTAVQADEELASPRQSSTPGGLSTSAVVGALLGVAAGAALTYGLVSSRDSPSPEHRDDPAPMLPRRATFPDKPVMSRRQPVWHEAQTTGVDYYNTPRKLAYPEPQSLPIRTAYPPNDRKALPQRESASPPRYSSSNRVGSKHRPSSRVEASDGLDQREGRSRYSSFSGVDRPVKIRSRSETPRERASGREDDLAGASVQTPRRGTAAESVISRSRPPPSRSHRPAYEGDLDSYVSARTHRSSSTARLPKTRPVEYDATPRSRPSSQVSVMTARELPRPPPSDVTSRYSAYSARKVPLPRSGVGSSHAHWEPRDIALPRSVAGSSHANWDPEDVPLPGSGVGSSHANWDDDLVSLAPSDSISCAGSKSSRRSRKHRR
jgi:catechol 2,3-dioxygenase-like lactoylglutathione lyase family enzyme